jgi:hypothetical protein
MSAGRTAAARRALSAALLALWLAPLGASRAAAGGGKEPCDGGVQRVGDLGIAALDCDCTYSGRSVTSDGRVARVRRWAFRSEPQVGGIRAGGPAAGRLREGDVITAIDGVLITTREGARRFINVAPGSPAVLTVRRDGREIPVRIVADAVCPDDALAPAGLFVMTPAPPGTPAPPAAPETEAAPEVPQTPEPPEAPEASQAPEAPRRVQSAARLPKPAIPTEEALPRGWSGFGLTCRNCGGRPGEEGAAPVWEFGTLPTIYFIDPGSPAARAGMQIGDVLTELDGVSLLTEEGGRRFGALQPGQSVRWTIRRGGRVIKLVEVTEPRRGEAEIPLTELKDKLRDLSERLRELSEHRDAERMSLEMQRLAREMERSGPQMTRVARARLRYAGAVGSSEVEVRGLENVVVDDNGDEIVITTPDATIRIRKAAASAQKQPEREKKK